MDMKNKIIIITLLILVGCSGFHLIKSDCYLDPVYEHRTYFHEISFCLRCDGSTYNFIDGNIVGVYLPECDYIDTVVHTHPIWGEPCASVVDYPIFKAYMDLYGNDTFAVLPSYGKIKIYQYLGND